MQVVVYESTLELAIEVDTGRTQARKIKNSLIMSKELVRFECRHYPIGVYIGSTVSDLSVS